MRRELVLYPATDVYTSEISRDPGSSPYPWDNSPSMTAPAVLADDLLSSYVYFSPHKTVGLSGAFLVGFDVALTLVLVREVKVGVWWSYAQKGANNWYFPPDNVGGPRLAPVVQNRAGSGLLAGSYHAISGGEIASANETTPTGFGSEVGFTPIYTEWVTTSHPEGGPWTLEDMHPAKFAAGASVAVESPAYVVDPGNAFFKVRIHKLLVTLQVEDLGGYVDSERHSASLILRMMRRARNIITPQTFADRNPATFGGRVYYSHPRGPRVGGLGWGKRRLERRPGLVLKRTYLPETFQVIDEAFDLEAFRCLWWAAYRIDTPWSPELQGLALIDKGGGFVHARAQDGWSARPGDGVLMRVLEGYPNLSPRGLAAQGGGDVTLAARNYDATLSGWSTTGSSGSFSSTQDLTVFAVDELGYQSSAKLEYGGGGGTGARYRSLGTLRRASGDYVSMRFIVRNTLVDPDTQNAECFLRRTGGGLAATEYWDEDARAWTTTPTYGAMPASDPTGEVIWDGVPCDAPGASSDPTYEAGIGRLSSSIASAIFHVGLIDAQKGGPSYGDAYGARSPIVTLDSPITRVRDSHRYPHTLAKELWSYERGVAMVELQPFYRAELLPDGTVKPLLHAQHATDTHDALQFVAVTGDDDLVRFERAVSGEATFQLDCPIVGIDITRAHVLRAWARWLGADGWTEYGPYSVEVGYAVFDAVTGALLGQGSTLGTLTYTGAMTSRDALYVGDDPTPRYADAWIRTAEVRRNPMSGLEVVWRL